MLATSACTTPSCILSILSLILEMLGSWVTMITVFSSSLLILRRYSTTILAFSVSSSPVGSSARISGGLFASAAANAIRCCSPPLSSPGLWSRLSLSPTTFSSSSIRFLRSSALIPRAAIGSSMFSDAVSVGIRFMFWKTCPTVSRLKLTSSPVDRFVRSVSKTLTEPALALSKPPMMFSSVVFPLPLGPMMLIISPLRTFTFKPLSACTSI